MATKAVIRCKRCGEKFPIYWCDASYEPIRCKNCSATMDEFTTGQVIQALAAAEEANHELRKSHLESNMPLFEVDFLHTTDYDDMVNESDED